MAETVSDVLQTRLELLGLSEYTRGFGAAAEASGLVSHSLDEGRLKLLGYGIAAASAAATIAAKVGEMAGEAGKIERLQAAFERLSGGPAGAAERVEELQGTLAAQRFGSEEVVRGALQLQRYGQSAEQANEIIQTLGDATAAGAGDAAQFGNAVGVVTQTLERQHLSMRELRALSRDTGPAFDALARSMGTSVLAVEQMEFQGPRAVEVLREFLRELARENTGGLQRDLDTLPGSMARLGHELDRLKESIGGPLVRPLVNAAKAVADFVQGIRNSGPIASGAATIIAGVAAGSLAIYSAATLWAFVNTGRYTKALLDLQLQHERTAQATTADALAQGEFVASTVAGGGASGGGAAASVAGGAAGATRTGIGGAALRGVGGLAVGFAAGQIVESAAQGHGDLASQLGRVGNRIATGAGAGFFAGSVIPGLGTAFGAAAGALLGGFEGVAEVAASRPGAAKSTPETLQETNSILKEQNALLAQIAAKGEGLVPGSDVPVAFQREIMRGMSRII